MKKILLAFLAGILLAMTSCSKDKSDNAGLDKSRYIRAWYGTATAGELIGYSMFCDVKSNGVGTFAYYFPGNPEVLKPLTWSKIAGDSIKVEFTCDDFPEYKFELRALSNADASLAPGVYYRIKKNDPSERVYRGPMTLD